MSTGVVTQPALPDPDFVAKEPEAHQAVDRALVLEEEVSNQEKKDLVELLGTLTGQPLAPALITDTHRP